LEEFFINRFGRELYLTFFKEYTEKVWGQKCNEISAEWGKQRIKGLNLTAALVHFLKSLFASKADIKQKNKETSLIERFLYPKLGPGQMWEIVAQHIQNKGGELFMYSQSGKIKTENNRITAIEVIDRKTGESRWLEGDYFFSTMPVKNLISDLQANIPERVKQIAAGLQYRDFFTVGLLVEDLKVKDDTENGKKLIADNWIYIQEPGVEIGRLQIFNNWSPYMVANKNTVWLGLEYFCYETDAIWHKTDEELIALGKNELDKIGIIEKNKVVDACVIRMPKTYPGYFGSYAQFDEVKNYISQFENLFLVGRNGMHKYNNQDHSMLTAMIAVDNIIAGIKSKDNLWEVNTEEEYHEEKK
jgi:protoporphyrinogen oxidase